MARARLRAKLITAILSPVLVFGVLEGGHEQLARSGIVRSQRGLHGGYRLVVSPEEVTILQVVQAVDPPRRIHKCPLDLEEHREMLCPLHKRIDDALAAVEEAFEKTTIAELLTNHGRPTGLCGVRRKSRRG